MTTTLDLEREARWETAAVERAVARYREFSATRDPSELPPGRRVLAETVGPVSARISAMLDEAATGSKGAPPGWHAPLLLFEPDVTAFVAVSTALRSSPVEQSRVGQTLPIYSRRVCAVLRDQADHDRFVRESRKAGKQGDTEAGALLRRWERCNPQADRRAWGRFAARLEGARSAKWAEEIRYEIGGALARALAEAAGDWFEVGRVGLGPEQRRPMHILLTPHAVERMLEVEARAEIARPILLPMLIPPNPWRYAPSKETA